MMSKKRQASDRPDASDDGVAVRSFAVRRLSSQTIPPHTHDWHQLIYASEGVMWVRTAQGDWVAPPNRAVWVPAGVEHAIDLSADVFMQTLYLPARSSRALPKRCCAVNVSPLLRELIVHAVSHRVLNRRIPAQARLINFLLDQLKALPTIPLQLPMPTDRRAKRAAAWLRDHPSDPGSLRQIAKRTGAGVRTLERIFRRETGMSFGKWRRQLRLLQALRLLAAGRSVTAVALDVGYDSPSAFIAMFRSILGTTPRRYFAATAGVPALEPSDALQGR